MAARHVALVIDNDLELLEEVQLIVESLGHRCHTAATQERAEALLDTHAFCYVLLDLELPVKANRVPRLETGFNILEGIRRRHGPDALPVIVMTAHGEDHVYPVRAFRMGATDYAKKPFDNNRQPLEDKIREAVAATCEARHPERCPNVGGGGAKAHKRKVPKEADRHACRTDDRFHFHGDCRNRRYRMTVNGRETWVRLGTFTGLCRLAARLLANPPGWLQGSALGENTNYHSALNRLKRDLREVAGIREEVIEGDGHGSFRLSVPPENLGWDLERLRAMGEGLEDLFEDL